MIRTVTSAASTIRGAMDELFPHTTDVDADGKPYAPFTPDAPGAYCHRCGATAGPGASDAHGCAFCREERVAWDGVTRLAAYVEPIDGHVREMKFMGRWRWAPWLGERLAAALPVFDGPVLVTPVPMWWARRWSRGYNQAGLIAHALAQGRGWPIAPVLRRTRGTPPQVSVTFAQRHANVATSFAIEPADLCGHTVVLVDDVKTSGSTLTACARLLRQAKAERIHIAVAAVADPKGRDFTQIDA